MSEYLLPCVCGKSVPVDVRQAGARVTCSCGTTLEVPTLRQIRHLPQAASVDVHSAPAWGPRQGIVAVCLILAISLLAWSAWVWRSEPEVPKFDPVARQKIVDQQIKTPLEAWNSWIGYYRPLAERGLHEFRVANAAQFETKKGEARFLRFMLWAMAACFGIIAVCAAWWPKPVARGPRG
ncbi:MAG TPA: hypothetical protein VH107_12840 [Lacipirellulaceae bacterium]|nr:hypothetical protein [Lacipirellulaceae bacterium]